MIYLSLIFIVLQLRRIESERIQCPVLTLPNHAFFFSGHCEREAGSLCGIGCLIGYQLVEGDGVRECQNDGTWTGDQPRCEGKMCLPLMELVFVHSDYRNPLSSIGN